MKIFILEDNPDRIYHFTMMCLDVEMVVSNNAEQSLKILKNEKFDYLFLDHDLGGKVYVDSNNSNTGSYLCEHIHETLNTETPVIVHSWNEVGANHMEHHLTDHNHQGSIEKLMFGIDEFNQKVSQIFQLIEKSQL